MSRELRRIEPVDAEVLTEFFNTAPALRLLAQARWRDGSETWGEFDGDLKSIVAIGGNALLHGELVDSAAVAQLLQRRPAVRALVGDADVVADVVAQRSRLIGGQPWLWRARQPYLLLSEPASGPAAGKVRSARLADLPAYTLAGAAMYRAELESEPDLSSLRRRFAASIRAGRSFAWAEQGVVRFKCDVSLVLGDSCHIQGVWLDQALRGMGWSAPLMADVLALVQRDIAPKVTLYVNDFNLPALRMYERLGFQQVGTFASAFY